MYSRAEAALCVNAINTGVNIAKKTMRWMVENAEDSPMPNVKNTGDTTEMLTNTRNTEITSKKIFLNFGASGSDEVLVCGCGDKTLECNFEQKSYIERFYISK